MAEIWIAGIGIGLTAYGMYSQKKASDNAAQVDTSTAAFNMRYDVTQAQQLDLDTLQNIRTSRQAGKEYLSRMDAAYASAGVLSNTGSALHAQVTTAGRLEQQIQQAYLDSQQRQQSLYTKAKAGILVGDAEATADRAQGTLSLLTGGANIARYAFNSYQSGMFSGRGGTSTGTVEGLTLD